MSVEIFSAETIGFTTDVTMPSMLSENDRALYYDVAKSYRGKGAVIEIGPWLGSGTYQIARGLEESGFPWSLTVFDRFKWASLYAGRYPEIGLNTGDSFLHLFRENLKPYIDRITAIAGEVGDIAKALPLERDIELLFVDAPKNWELLWGVLEHVRTQMQPGSKLVFQDFFHITSRQIIWLLMSIPQLRLTRMLSFGSSVVFTIEAPIPPLDSFLPRDMQALTVSDLLTMWQRLRHEFPEQRSGALAAGMALDLLARDAVEEALAVLDEGAIGKPWQLKVADDLNRLIRPKGKDRDFLIEIGAYLRAQIHPATTRAARARAAAEMRARQAATGEPADTVLGSLDRRQLLRLAEEMRAPTTVAGLAARHAYENGPFDSRLFTVFSHAVRSNAVAWPLQLADLVAGQDVVELYPGVTLHGLVMRSLGARSYVGLDPGFSPEQNGYSSHTAPGTLRTKFPIGEICGMLPGFSYVTEPSQLGSRAGLVLARPAADLARLEDTLVKAEEVLRPDGRIYLWWRNPLSWSGHGQAPQLAAELDPGNPRHTAVADWAHLRGANKSLPTLPQVRAAIEAHLDILEWEEHGEDPEALLRLTASVRRGLPKLPIENFVIKEVMVTAALRQEPTEISSARAAAVGKSGNRTTPRTRR